MGRPDSAEEIDAEADQRLGGASEGNEDVGGEQQVQLLKEMKMRLRGMGRSKDATEAQPDVDMLCRDEDHLLRFLRKADGNVDRAYESLVKYTLFFRHLYGLKPSDGPFKHVAVEETKQCLCEGVIYPTDATATDAAGRPLLVCPSLAGLVDLAQKYGARHVYQSVYLMYDELTKQEGAQQRGMTYVANLSDFGVGTLRKYMSSKELRRLGMLESEVAAHIPMSFGNIILCNAPWYFRSTWSLIRPMLPAALKAKVVFVNAEPATKPKAGEGVDGAGIERFIPLSSLPESFGGTLARPPEHFVNPLLERRSTRLAVKERWGWGG